MFQNYLPTKPFFEMNMDELKIIFTQLFGKTERRKTKRILQNIRFRNRTRKRRKTLKKYF